MWLAISSGRRGGPTNGRFHHRLRNIFHRFHLTLAEVFALISDNASDTTSRNCARKGSLTNNSVLYRTPFDERDFSIRPQTLNIRLRSSLATSNRWSLLSNVSAYDRESDNSILYVCRQMTKSITLYMGAM